MKKYSLIPLLLLIVFTFISLNEVSAKVTRSNQTLSTPGQEVSLQLPEAAKHSSVISLGSTLDQDNGRLIEGYAFIRRQDNYAKGGNGGGKGNKPDSNKSSCYAFMSSGMKWKTNEPWVVNPTNRDNLDHDFVLSNLSFNINKWETAANSPILGDGQITTDLLEADLVRPDEVNEVYFADIDEPNVIGVTIVWGYFSGPPKFREIIEWDQVYDDVDFDWTQDAASESSKMDFEGISTHELGHTIGLADLYTADCNQETMYGYGGVGQTYQRDLNLGDITGAAQLYK